MATGLELKKLAHARRRTAKILIDAEDWEAAAYMMGYALETLLKSCACKALRIEKYPDDKSKHDKILKLFMNHVFDQLLLISGQSDIFAPNDAESGPAFSWSQFTTSYLGDWVNMRYRPDISKEFPEAKVLELYGYLYESEDSIFKTVQDKRRW